MSGPTRSTASRAGLTAAAVVGQRVAAEAVDRHAEASTCSGSRPTCIGEHLGIGRSGGLGQLSSEQLARLAETAAATLTSAGLEHAARAWAALRAPDPSGLAGCRVLEGRADHVALNGVDRWIGGVHLTGTSIPWRWDDGTETITARRSSGR